MALISILFTGNLCLLIAAQGDPLVVPEPDRWPGAEGLGGTGRHDSLDRWPASMGPHVTETGAQVTQNGIQGGNRKSTPSRAVRTLQGALRGRSDAEQRSLLGMLRVRQGDVHGVVGGSTAPRPARGAGLAAPAHQGQP